MTFYAKSSDNTYFGVSSSQVAPSGCYSVPSRPDSSKSDYSWDAASSSWIRGVTATLSSLEKKKDQIIALGAIYNGHTYQISDGTPDYLGSLARSVLAIEAGISAPSGGTYPDISNNEITLTDDKLVAMAKAVGSYWAKVVTKWRAYKTIVRGYADIPGGLTADQQADALDITQGWPVNG